MQTRDLNSRVWYSEVLLPWKENTGQKEALQVPLSPEMEDSYLQRQDEALGAQSESSALSSRWEQNCDIGPPSLSPHKPPGPCYPGF